jgi:hypothetical protein
MMGLRSRTCGIRRSQRGQQADGNDGDRGHGDKSKPPLLPLRALM